MVSFIWVENKHIKEPPPRSQGSISIDLDFKHLDCSRLEMFYSQNTTSVGKNLSSFSPSFSTKKYMTEWLF